MEGSETNQCKSISIKTEICIVLWTILASNSVVNISNAIFYKHLFSFTYEFVILLGWNLAS